MNRWLDRLITLLLIALLSWAGWSTLHWLVNGADWSVVSTNLPLYAVGSYPADQRWRPLLWIGMLVLLIGLTLVGPKRGVVRRSLPVVWIVMAPLGLWLLAGGLGLLPVGSRDWGGLTLTVLLTIGSGLLALPLGVLLALGRRSALPVLRFSSSAYIELMRAVPLIAVLFFGQLLIPLFLPPGLEINRVLRAVVAFALLRRPASLKMCGGVFRRSRPPSGRRRWFWDSRPGRPCSWWFCLRPCVSLCRHSPIRRWACCRTPV